MNKKFKLNVTIDNLTFQVTGIKIDNRYALINITCPSNLTILNYNIMNKLEDTLTSQFSINSFNIENIELNEGLRQINSYALYRTTIKKICIPHTVERIGKSAFAECDKLEEIILNEGLQEISISAFEGAAIKKIIFPHSIVKLGTYAFCNCDKLEEIILNEGIKQICTNTFYSTKIKKIVFPHTMIKIGFNAFQNCDKLEEIILNEGLQTINPSAFEGTAIKKIIFPHTMVKIGFNAFQNCDKLEEVILNEGLQEIDMGAFEKTAIKKIVFPSTITEIRTDAFCECDKLEEIILNEGIKQIGPLAFAYTSIREITIPSTVEKIETTAFEGCKNLEKVIISPYSKLANYSNEEFQKIFGKNIKIEIGASFKFNEEEFKQYRQTVSKDNANKLGIKLISLVSKKHLNEEDLQLAYDLLIQGANPDTQDSFGNTGLMYMIDKQLDDGINMYLASGCNINIANNLGDTALIKAARLNMINLFSRLLDMNAHYQHQNMDDEDALSIAEENHFIDIMNLIKACQNHNQSTSKSINLTDIKAKAKQLKQNNP